MSDALSLLHDFTAFFFAQGHRSLNLTFQIGSGWQRALLSPFPFLAPIVIATLIQFCLEAFLSREAGTVFRCKPFSMWDRNILIRFFSYLPPPHYPRKTPPHPDLPSILGLKAFLYRLVPNRRYRSVSGGKSAAALGFVFFPPLLLFFPVF